jgi:hypothetical protein
VNHQVPSVARGFFSKLLVPWSARFVDPIILPDGRKLLTLREVAQYITDLPKAEHDAEERQNRDGSLAAGRRA